MWSSAKTPPRAWLALVLLAALLSPSAAVAQPTSGNPPSAPTLQQGQGENGVAKDAGEEDTGRKSRKRLRLGFAARGRAESLTGAGYLPSNDDSYYLQRTRLNLGFDPFSWFTAFAEVQDSRAFGYLAKPAPPTVENQLDLRQAYLDLHRAAGGWSARLGRQELLFGEGRLVGNGNWSNAARSFDAAVLSHRGPDSRVDCFASSVVKPRNNHFDRPQVRERLSGLYSSFSRWLPGATVEPYWLWKSAPGARSETGRFGRSDVYTAGARIDGTTPWRAPFAVETAFQLGKYAGEPVRAWAGHLRLGFARSGTLLPHPTIEYNYASGDHDPQDGRRATFDQLYPTNHASYGTADRIGWRNIHDAMAGIEWQPFGNWRASLDVHNFWLATRRDSLYSEAGAPLVRNPSASSSRVGTELDLQFTWPITPRLLIGAGYAHLFPGPYLRQSTAGSAVSYPYLMWEYKH